VHSHVGRCWSTHHVTSQTSFLFYLVSLIQTSLKALHIIKEKFLNVITFIFSDPRNTCEYCSSYIKPASHFLNLSEYILRSSEPINSLKNFSSLYIIPAFELARQLYNAYVQTPFYLSVEALGHSGSIHERKL
jgi:hypothetical protein